MAAYVKYDTFSEQITKGVQAFGTDTYKLALTNATPAVTDATFAYAAPSAANGYPTGGATVTVTVTRTGTNPSTTAVSSAQVTFTATAGGIGPFRYAVLYNFTDASNNLIAYWDYASSITLSTAGDQFIVKFANTDPGNIFTVS
jgi:hypothetical protein